MNQRVLDILQIPEETQTIEFKRLGGEKVVSKIIETIVAMSNTDGGVLILGVDDPEKTKLKGEERIFGIEENNDTYDAIGREIQLISPPIGNLWPPENIKTDYLDRTIAKLVIPKSKEHLHNINNQVFRRQRKSNIKLTVAEVIKFSYAKGFEKADRELVDVDLQLLETDYFDAWRRKRDIPAGSTSNILFNTGLARKDAKGQILPTRAAVLLFALFPTEIMDTKCTVRIFQYTGSIETFKETPNLVSTPKTIGGPIIEVLRKSHEYILTLLQNGIEIHSGFITKYKLPERAVKEAITNAVIHRDYHIKRDIEVKIFEDRIEVHSPGLLPYNITTINIGRVRADGYRNDLIVKHLREFPEAPNLDRNEGVQAMRNEMSSRNLFDPIYFTYPYYQDSVNVILLNEERSTEWEKVKEYLLVNTYINNAEARRITSIKQVYSMSRLLKKWVTQGLLLKITPENRSTKNIRYKLINTSDLPEKTL